MSLPLLLAVQTMVSTGTALALPVPATDWSCQLDAAGGARFGLSGRTPAFPTGFDMNSSVPTQVEGEGVLSGEARISPGRGGDHFREFQISAYRPGGERYNLNLLLRRDGTSVAYATKYVENDRRIPYDYFAAGLCSADFDVTESPAQ